jgi:hypothetical protein
VEYGCFCGGLGGEPILGSFFPFLVFDSCDFGSSAKDGDSIPMKRLPF